MIRVILAPLMLALSIGGCATRHAPSPLTPAEHVQAGLDALDGGDLSGALRHLEAAAEDGDGAVARQARLLGAAVALDPRNPSRDPNLAARLAGPTAGDTGSAWEAALGRTLYSIALDLGARRAAVSSETTADLPHLTGPSLAARMQQLESTVAELRKELERIRETLKP